MLSPAQRSLALARIDADQIIKTGGQRERTNLRSVLRAFSFNVSSLIYSWYSRSRDDAAETTGIDHLVYNLFYICQHIIPGTESFHAYGGRYSFVCLLTFEIHRFRHSFLLVGKFSASPCNYYRYRSLLLLTLSQNLAVVHSQVSW